jgi:hypothetical protein
MPTHIFNVFASYSACFQAAGLVPSFLSTFDPAAALTIAFPDVGSNPPRTWFSSSVSHHISHGSSCTLSACFRILTSDPGLARSLWSRPYERGSIYPGTGQFHHGRRWRCLSGQLGRHRRSRLCARARQLWSILWCTHRGSNVRIRKTISQFRACFVSYHSLTHPLQSTSQYKTTTSASSSVAVVLITKKA